MANNWLTANLRNDKDIIASIQSFIQNENANLVHFVRQSLEQQQLNMQMHFHQLQTVLQAQLKQLESRVQQSMTIQSHEHLHNEMEIKTSLKSHQQQLYDFIQQQTSEVQECFKINTQHTISHFKTQEENASTKRHVEDILLSLYGKCSNTCAHFSFELSRNLNPSQGSLSTENIENISACFRMDGNVVTTHMLSSTWFVTVHVKNRIYACTLLTKYVSGELLQSIKKEIEFDVIQLIEAKVVPNESGFHVSKESKSKACTMVNSPNVTSLANCVTHVSSNFQPITNLVVSPKPVFPHDSSVHSSHTSSFLDSTLASTPPPDELDDQSHFSSFLPPSFSELQSKNDSEICSTSPNIKSSTPNVLIDQSTRALTDLSAIEHHHKDEERALDSHSDVIQHTLDILGEQKLHVNHLFLHVQRHKQLFSDVKTMEDVLLKEKAFSISNCYVEKA